MVMKNHVSIFSEHKNFTLSPSDSELGSLVA